MTDDIMIDFTEQEPYEAKDFSPVPRGKYHVAITDGEMREVGQGDNAGKPYVALELTIQEGPYQGRKLWTNVMLFPDKNGKMISAMGVLTATNKVGKFTVSEFVDRVQGEEMIVSVTIRKSEQYGDSNNVRAFFPVSAGLGPQTPATGKRSLLPS